VQSAYFEPFNRAGAAVTLLAGGEKINLGPGVEFRVLRADPAGGFWLLWKALGYQEGQQFSHTVRIVSAAAAGDELRITDVDDQVLVLVPYSDRDRWRGWQEYRRRNTAMFAEIDAGLLAEALRGTSRRA
jgi:antitoxin (DNA-binding transcriptional repressor) of toxin-antitoxin stability system